MAAWHQFFTSWRSVLQQKCSHTKGIVHCTAWWPCSLWNIPINWALNSMDKWVDDIWPHLAHTLCSIFLAIKPADQPGFHTFTLILIWSCIFDHVWVSCQALHIALSYWYQYLLNFLHDSQWYLAQDIYHFTMHFYFFLVWHLFLINAPTLNEFLLWFLKVILTFDDVRS